MTAEADLKYIWTCFRAEPNIETFEEAIEALGDLFFFPDSCQDDPKASESECSMSRCSETPWSSRHPDPKSTILGVDEESGGLR